MCRSRPLVELFVVFGKLLSPSPGLFGFVVLLHFSPFGRCLIQLLSSYPVLPLSSLLDVVVHVEWLAFDKTVCYFWHLRLSLHLLRAQWRQIVWLVETGSSWLSCCHRKSVLVHLRNAFALARRHILLALTAACASECCSIALAEEG